MNQWSPTSWPNESDRVKAHDKSCLEYLWGETTIKLWEKFRLSRVTIALWTHSITVLLQVCVWDPILLSELIVRSQADWQIIRHWRRRRYRIWPVTNGNYPFTPFLHWILNLFGSRSKDLISSLWGRRERLQNCGTWCATTIRVKKLCLSSMGLLRQRSSLQLSHHHRTYFILNGFSPCWSFPEWKGTSYASGSRASL